MADNIVLNPGEGGDSVAADEIAGVKYVIDKVAYGADGSVTLVSAANGLPINLVKSVVSVVSTGSVTTTANTPVQLVGSSLPTTRGVVVKNSVQSTNSVYVGAVGVTPGTASATDGFELSSGESITIPIDDVNKVYVTSTVSGQKVFWSMV